MLEHPSWWAPTSRPDTPEISDTEFCYTSVNLSIEELRNIKTILFLAYGQFREISQFSNQHDNSLGRHVHAASRRKLRNSISLSENQGPMLSELKFV